MKKLLIVLFLATVPISSFAVSQTEIDSAKSSLAGDLISNKTLYLVGQKFTLAQANNVADLSGVHLEQMLKENEKEKVWSKSKAPFFVATCLYGRIFSQVSL